MSAPVLGFDGYPGGWVCALVRDGALERVFACRALEDALGAAERAGERVAAIGVDMPVALAPSGVRRADNDARRFVRPLSSSVFAIPPLPALAAPDYATAVSVAREHDGPAPSRQCFALFPKIRQARALCGSGRQLFEVHPEVTFRHMAGRPLVSKRSHTGVFERLELLRGRGLAPPTVLDALEPGQRLPAPAAQDVLDAVAVAWSASRIAAGAASCLPANPTDEERAGNMLVWY